MIEAALKHHLATHDETAIVETNIYPVILPSGVTADSIVYRKAKGGRRQNLNSAAGDALPNFVVSAWSTDYDRAVDLGQRIFRAMEMFSGEWEAEAGTLTVNSVLNTDSRDDYSPPDDGSEEFMFVRHEEFQIQFNEEIPTQD